MELQVREMDKALDNNILYLIGNGGEGIIGVETATAYWGLSTFSYDNIIIMFNDNKLDNEGYEVQLDTSYLFVPNLNTDNLVQLSDKLFITDKEQTICDMVRYNRHEFHLFETIVSAFENSDINRERLKNLADQYGIWNRMEELYAEALEDEEEYL